MSRKWLLGGAAVLVLAFIGIRFGGQQGAKQELDTLLAHLPPGYAATHGAVSYNAVTGSGHVDALAVSRNGQRLFAAQEVDISGLQQGAPGQAPELIGHLVLHNVTAPFAPHIATMAFDDLHLANLVALFDPSRYPNGKPAATDDKPILESLTITDATMHADPKDLPPQAGNQPAPAVDVHVARARQEGISARQFAVAPPSGGAMSPEFIAAIGAAFSQKSSSMEDLTETVGDAGEFRFGSGSADGYVRGRLDSEIVRDFSFHLNRPGGGIVSMAKMEFSGLDMREFLARMPAIMAAAKRKDAKPNMDLGMHLASFGLDDFVVDVPAAPRFALSSIRLDNSGAGSAFAMHGLSVVTSKRPLPPKARASLDAFGMADFTADMDIQAAEDAATGRQMLKHLDILLHNLGSLHMSAAIDNWHAPAMGSADAMTAAFEAARIVSASVRWDDDSLTGRVFHMMSVQSGQPEEQLQAAASLALIPIAMNMPDQPDAAQQVQAFLSGRHALIVTVKPPAPVAVGALKGMKPADATRALGLRIEGS
jgi:hypothetical protein